MFGENIRVFMRIRSATCGVETDSERFVRCIQRVGEDGIKFDCERCAKRQFAELMPSAPNGTVFSPVSSPGNHLECPNDIKERFDGVFSESSNCDEIYRSSFQTAAELAVQGYNCSLIACGAAATGKSFSIFGSKSASETNPGIIAMAIKDLFRIVADETSQVGSPSISSQIHVEMSCVELSGTQQCRNLLKGLGLASNRLNNQSMSSMSMDDITVNGSVSSALSSSPGYLKGLEAFSALRRKSGHVSINDAETFDSPQVGVFLSGTDLKIKVKSAEEALILLHKATSARSTRSVPLPGSVGGKQQHYLSNKSHVVVTLYVESKVDPTLEESNSPLVTSVGSSVKRGKKNTADPNTTPSTCKQQLRLGRLQIVDLAGASVPTSTQDSMDTFIKRSLHTLGEVITGLSTTATLSPSMHSGGKHSRRPSAGSSSTGTSHIRVPYLDSKLTYLLKDSFGGLSKTAMLFHVSPLVQDYQVTLPTLQLALKAALIRNNVRPVRIFAAPEEIMDLKFDSFLISNLKAQFMSSYEADILTNRSFSRKLSMLPSSSSSKKLSKQLLLPSTAPTTHSPQLSMQSFDSKVENQQERSICSPLAELPISLPPVPLQFSTAIFSPDSSSQKTLTLSERMRTKLGDNCMLALDQPELSAESLAALDQTVSVARSLRQELQGELEQLEDNNSFPDGALTEADLSVIAECEQESRRCSIVALTSDLQELDLVSRLAKKLRSTLQQLQQQQQLTEDLKVGRESIERESSNSPDIGVSPREVMLNGDDFMDDDFDILDIFPTGTQAEEIFQDNKDETDHQTQQEGNDKFETEMDDASMCQRQGYDDDLDYENQSNFNDQNEHQNENRESWHIDNRYDVSSLLRQRVDELRETLNLLQQNQAVALEGCLEQLLQATTAAGATSKENSGKGKQKKNQKRSGRNKKRGTVQLVYSDAESDISSADSMSESRGDKNSSMTPMSIRSVAVAFDDAYNKNANEDEQYMRNPLLTAKPVSRNVTPLPHILIATSTPSLSDQKRTSRANSYDRLDIALRENKILRSQIDQYNNTADDSDVGTRNENAYNSNMNNNINNHVSSSTSPSLATANTTNLLAASSDSSTALTALTTLLKNERSQLSEAQVQLQRSEIDLALARQECEHSEKTILTLQGDINALREELRRTDTLHGQLQEQLRSTTKKAFSEKDNETISPGRDLFSSPVGSGFRAEPPSSAAQPSGGLILDPVEVKSPFSLISAVYSTLHLRPFFRESTDSPDEDELYEQSASDQPVENQVFTSPTREWDFHPVEMEPTVEQTSSAQESQHASDEKIELLEKSLAELRSVSAGYEEHLSAVQTALQQAKTDLAQSRTEAKDQIDNLIAQLKRKDEEISTQQINNSPKPSPAAVESSPRQQLTSPKKTELSGQGQSEEVASLIHENQQLKYEVVFQSKLVANANRNVSDLLTLLSEKNDELQVLRTTYTHLSASISKSGSPTAPVQPELAFPHPQINPLSGQVLSAQRDKEKTRSRNRALALVNSSDQGAFVSRALPAPLTSQTETGAELERPISPLTEDSFSINRDPDELALEQGLRLSLQHHPQHSHPQHPNYLYPHALPRQQQPSLELEQPAVQRVLVFDDENAHIPQRQLQLIRPIQDPNLAQVALPTNINHSNLVGSPQHIVDLPQSSPDMRSPQEDAEIRRIMSRGYSYELASEIFFKMKSRSSVQSSEKLKK